MQLLLDRTALVAVLPYNGVVAEVGVQRGQFSGVILELSQPRELYLIDCWAFQPGAYESDPSNVPVDEQAARYVRVKERFARHTNVHVIRGYSAHVARIFPPQTFDWVYIDACHLYVEATQDIETWWRKVKPGGYLAGHDYCETLECIEVKEAVDDFCRERGLELAYVTQEADYPSWAIRKPLLGYRGE